jgi:cytochrome P450
MDEEKAVSEIDDKGTISLPVYVEAVFKEAMRKYPVAPSGMCFFLFLTINVCKPL